MVRSIVYLFIPLTLCLRTDVEGQKDFYSSSLRTEFLSETHSQLLSIIKEYAVAMKELESILLRYTSENETRQISGEWESNGDPLKTYLLIRKTTVDLDSIVDAVQKIRSLDPLLEIDSLRRKERLPDPMDFEGISKSLVRIQKMYQIPPEDLSLGRIAENIQSTVKLTASDCLHIGEISETVSRGHAELWYSAGIALAQNHSEEAVALQLLRDRQSSLKERTKALKVTTKIVAEFNEDIFNNTLDLRAGWPYIQTIGRRLCRGESIRSPSMDAENFCYLRRGPHPYLKLRPLKLEVKSADPYLVVLHDVVGEREIERFKEAVYKQNEPSSMALGVSGFRDSRVSVTSWLHDTHSPSLTKRIEAFLGMNANETLYDVEPYQVLNYGVGGHYTLHKDHLRKNNENEIDIIFGNRIATLMIYLNEVDKGGFTIFPYMGLALRPIAGAAAFWWNMRSGGDVDIKTTHAACPVMYGTKWVVNKWFGDNGQMFRKPCGPDPHGIVGHL